MSIKHRRQLEPTCQCWGGGGAQRTCSDTVTQGSGGIDRQEGEMGDFCSLNRLPN